MVGASALSAQNTSATHSGWGLVFDRASNRMHAARLEDLTSRTAVDVAQWIISKGFIAEDRFARAVLRFTQRISHVGSNPALLTSDVVLSRAILVIGYDDLRLAARVALVLIESTQAVFCFPQWSQALSPSR